MDPKVEATMMEHTMQSTQNDHTQDTITAAEERMAIQATLSEHDLKIWEAFRRYKKACLWSILVSMSIIMRAYDIEINGNFYALPAFRNRFSEHVEGHGMEIPVQCSSRQVSLAPSSIGLVLWWCPESPWWLIRQNRLEDAKKSLDRLSSKQCHAKNDSVLAMMVKTDQYEREVGVSFRDCFKGPNLRRLEIASAVFIVQNFSANPVGFAVYLFEQTGLSSANAFNMGIGLNGVGFVGVFCSVFPITWLGRRRTWLYGLAYNIARLWIVAFLCLAPDCKSNASHSWAQASVLITIQLIYSLSVGRLAFVVSSEVPSTRLRAKTLSLTATFNGLSYLVITIAGPCLLNPGSANAGAMIEFLWGGLSLFSFAWSYFRLPEPGDRIFEEIDYLFKNRVPARKFRSYVIDETHGLPSMAKKADADD
ncbi:hypothetical protein NW762_012161 [Fusarium torreyae]|uniref:Major facilitator superfamily (MFS) profile domain-containing protein n=1 Tax=Fusarium torreyae TaxID=1237075 RepID=A0A9W8RQP3_9HYPO|nr:hypothetical protein NW762_012161 [Fusarium torreyae]